MRILITGAAGRVGSEMVKYIGSEHEVIGTFRPAQRELPISCGTAVRVDLAEASSVKEMFEVHRPDLVIHSAAATSVDRCELDPEYARTGNVIATENVIAGLEELETGRLIYISTDYVFSGEEASPSEDAFPRPINVYGKTKLKGERLVLESEVDASIIRVCALYTATAHPKGDPISSIFETLQDGKTYPAATDLCSNPTEVSDVARAIAALIKLEDLPTILHVAAPQYLSRYDFCVKVAKRLKLNAGLIKKVKAADLNLPAPRPLRAGLASARFGNLMGYSLKSVEELPRLSR